MIFNLFLGLRFGQETPIWHQEQSKLSGPEVTLWVKYAPLVGLSFNILILSKKIFLQNESFMVKISVEGLTKVNVKKASLKGKVLFRPKQIKIL